MLYTPRIFVGTLACGEAEFEECCSSIKSQIGVNITHHIIQNQPEYAAHNMLWQAWGNHRSDHDLFVKIDADTVLNRQTALVELASLFSQPDVTGAQIPLLDYFTDDLISGLNAFSPAVRFRPSRWKLFADHADYGHQRVLKGESVKHLAPIGWHGKNPSPRQSFHFGLHRKLKGQDMVLYKTAQSWKKYQDDARGWALAGAASARWWMWGKTHYTSWVFQRTFRMMQNDNIRQEIIENYIRGHIIKEQEKEGVR